MLNFNVNLSKESKIFIKASVVMHAQSKTLMADVINA